MRNFARRSLVYPLFGGVVACAPAHPPATEAVAVRPEAPAAPTSAASPTSEAPSRAREPAANGSQNSERAVAAGAGTAVGLAAGPTGGWSSQNRPTLEQLRQFYPTENEAAACADDSQCGAPLRCISSTCSYPIAMSGQTDNQTVVAMFPAQNGARRYFLETAMSRAEQARGLMFRRLLLDDFGMIFVFPNEEPRSFWMRNTLIPLDMVFVTSDGTIDSIVTNATPLTETPRPSAGPAKYVIELNAGDAAEMALRAGAKIELLNVPPALGSSGN